MPVFYVASLLVVLQGGPRHILGNDHVLWLMIASVMGWLLTWWHVGTHHQFAHLSIGHRTVMLIDHLGVKTGHHMSHVPLPLPPGVSKKHGIGFG